jgi:hypothetical protein
VGAAGSGGGEDSSTDNINNSQLIYLQLSKNPKFSMLEKCNLCNLCSSVVGYLIRSGVVK